MSTVLDVLRAAGFRVLDDGSDHVTLRRGARWLQIPKSDEALRTRWNAVLASAGMDESTFHTLAGAASAMLSELPSSRNLRAAADVSEQPNGRSRR